MTLRDAYGNIIDQVTYNDDLPWPEQADGQGSFLKLVSLDLDNSLASSWVAVDDVSQNLTISQHNLDSFVSIFPNPVSSVLRINTSLSRIVGVKLFSINGKLFKNLQFNSNQIRIDLNAFENGIYLLEIQTENTVLTKKIIKK